MTYEESRRRFTAKVNEGSLKMALQFKRLDSYKKAADKCGVSKSTIANLMSGQRTTVNPETAAKIERNLEVDPGSIFSLVSLTVESPVSRRKAAA